MINPQLKAMPTPMDTHVKLDLAEEQLRMPDYMHTDLPYLAADSLTLLQEPQSFHYFNFEPQYVTAYWIPSLIYILAAKDYFSYINPVLKSN